MSRHAGRTGLRNPIQRLALCLLLPALAAAPALHAAEDAEAAALQERLAALRANPDLANLAPLERLRAEQALAALAEARRRDRENALHVARRRVEIAEIAARTARAERETAALDRTRNELLAEASRREAERARREAEQLRVQARIQAEELERLRMAAEEEALARQEAEQTLITVAGQQTARVSAARQKEAKLARQEAELVAGAKLPPSKFEARGEVFTLPGEALAGQGRLAPEAAGSLAALASYLQIAGKGKVRIEGQADAVLAARGYAEAVRDALAAGGVAADRLQVLGRAGKPGVTVIIAP